MSPKLPAAFRDRPALRAGFTLIELLTVIAIIGVLAAILFPAISNVRKSAQNTQCVSNVRQWTQAAMLYAADHKGSYALRAMASDGLTNSYWDNISTDPKAMLYGPYFENWSNVSKLRACPSYYGTAGNGNTATCYSMNRPYIGSSNTVVGANAISLRAATNPANLLLMSEVDPVSAGTGNPWFIGKAGLKAVLDPLWADSSLQRHGSHVNASFVDGHVAAITQAQIEQYGDTWTRL